MEEDDALRAAAPPNVVSYTIAIAALAKAGELRAALAELERMEARGIAADCVCYNALVSGHAAAGALAEASDGCHDQLI